MTQKRDPYENAIAERVNGILKSEFGLDKVFENYNQACATVAQSIETYNSLRPHSSCSYLTPMQAHDYEGQLHRLWKNYWKDDNKKNDPISIQKF